MVTDGMNKEKNKDLSNTRTPFRTRHLFDIEEGNTVTHIWEILIFTPAISCRLYLFFILKFMIFCFSLGFFFTPHRFTSTHAACPYVRVIVKVRPSVAGFNKKKCNALSWRLRAQDAQKNKLLKKKNINKENEKTIVEKTKWHVVHRTKWISHDKRDGNWILLAVNNSTQWF